MYVWFWPTLRIPLQVLHLNCPHTVGVMQEHTTHTHTRTHPLETCFGTQYGDLGSLYDTDVHKNAHAHTHTCARPTQAPLFCWAASPASHTHAHTYTPHIHMQTYTHPHTHTHSHAHAHTYTHTHTTHTHADIHAPTHAHTPYTHMQTYTCTHLGTRFQVMPLVLHGHTAHHDTRAHAFRAGHAERADLLLNLQCTGVCTCHDFRIE